RLGVRHDLGPQELDREALLDVDVLGRVDLPHPAFPELADQAVATVEDLTDQRGGLDLGDRPRGWRTINRHEVAIITRYGDRGSRGPPGRQTPRVALASSMGAKIITKTDRQMEDRLLAVSDDPVRADTLQKARAFKRTWLELAEALTRA